MKEITIIVPNKIGALADIAEALGNNGINIESIAGQGFQNQGVIRIITNDEKSALHTLTKMPAVKEGEYEIKIGDVMLITMSDKPGELAKLTRKIARAGINLESVYELKKDHEVQLIVKPEKIADAVEALRKSGVNVKV